MNTLFDIYMITVLVIPIALGILAFLLWAHYVRAYFISTRKNVLLEISCLGNMQNDPRAMERALLGFHQTGQEKGIGKKFWRGSIRPWFSLELVSIEGTVRFFIRTEESYKNIVISSICEEYKTAEIRGVPDYTHNVRYTSHGAWDLFGTEFELTKPDEYPIRTYEDMGGDHYDQLAEISSFLTSLNANEQVWIQILVRAHRPTNRWARFLFGSRNDWKAGGRKLLKKLRSVAGKHPGQHADEVITAVERSIMKLGFDTGIRAIYLARSSVYRKTNISAVLGLFRHLDSETLNGFRGGSYCTDIQYPWQDFNGIRLAFRKADMFNNYVRRNYFYPPHKRKWFVLNQEEIATIYHFLNVPEHATISVRTNSGQAEPPSNLPV